MELDIADEEYVIQRAKEALKIDPFSAKAWMLTAKTLYPNNFGVQFEAYVIEKNAGHVKEAAKCFSDLITKFQQQPDLWKEIEKVTIALRAESEDKTESEMFLCEMFKHISSEVQHKLLLFTADHCEDTLEHCRLLLLLLQRFPTAISSYGPRLLDTLLSAEKHSVDGHFPVNSFRKLLVCDLLPLLGNEEVNVELTPKILYKLLYKSLEYYLVLLGLSNNSQENELKKEDCWEKLFAVIEFIGKQLKWEPQLLDFKDNWTRESYWQKLVSFNLNSTKHANFDEKQLFYCLTVFFFYCLHGYNTSLSPEPSPGQTPVYFSLTEAFIDPSLSSPLNEQQKTKKRKPDDTLPYISVEKSELKNIPSNFLMCINSWELLQAQEPLKKEFEKLLVSLKLQTWMSIFIIDFAIYKGQYEEALLLLQGVSDSHIFLNKFVRIANILFVQKNYRACLEAIILALPHLPSNLGSLSTGLIIGGSQRHLHYIPLTKLNVLQFFVKMLLRAIKESISKHNCNELAIGHIFTLVQLDWPQEEDMVAPLLEQIKENRSFHYHLFQNYIINVDILEEITYLWTSQGGQIQLDILPHLGQRRIGTRGADKGAKEEIKQAIRRQIARNNENLEELLIKFIRLETSHILQVLV